MVSGEETMNNTLKTYFITLCASMAMLMITLAMPTRYFPDLKFFLICVEVILIFGAVCFMPTGVKQ